MAHTSSMATPAPGALSESWRIGRVTLISPVWGDVTWTVPAVSVYFEGHDGLFVGIVDVDNGATIKVVLFTNVTVRVNKSGVSLTVRPVA